MCVFKRRLLAEVYTRRAILVFCVFVTKSETVHFAHAMCRLCQISLPHLLIQSPHLRKNIIKTN